MVIDLLTERFKAYSKSSKGSTASSSLDAIPRAVVSKASRVEGEAELMKLQTSTHHKQIRISGAQRLGSFGNCHKLKAAHRLQQEC